MWKLSHTTKKQKQLQQILLKKNAICETNNFYLLLAFLLINITLLIAVSVYCCLIKYETKQKHLLPFHLTNNKLKEIMC